MYIVYPTTLLKEKKKKEGGREGERKEGKEGGRNTLHITYLLKLTFLDVSGFNSVVLSMVGWAVHCYRSLAESVDGA